MRIDLHTHSNASDGQYSPAELVKLAAADGIKILALTDHDTVAGLEEAGAAAAAAGIRFVPGLEISTELSEACLERILTEEGAEENIPAASQLLRAANAANTDELAGNIPAASGSANCADACGTGEKDRLPDMADFTPEERSQLLNEDIHVLGLGIDKRDDRIREFCERYARERLGRGDKICAFLAGKGINVDMEEVHAIRKGASLGRPHFAEYLLRHGFVTSKAEAFEIYLDTDEFNAATKRMKPTPYEAVNVIHAAGGRAVLAHPGLLKFTGRTQERVIASLVRGGLDGIECFYNRHDAGQTKYYLSLMEKHGISTGCGSDFHGERVKVDVKLGMDLPDEFVDKLAVNNVRPKE